MQMFVPTGMLTFKDIYRVKIFMITINIQNFTENVGVLFGIAIVTHL